jgi:hypothetical protein
MPFGLGFFATAGAGGAAGSFDLLETQVLGSSASSVTFSSLSTYAATYQHLQIRMLTKNTTNDFSNNFAARLNGDTGSNYRDHRLFGNGSSVSSAASASSTFMTCGRFARSSGSTFSPGVIDILDPFETTKNKVIRAFYGSFEDSFVMLNSGLWINTAAVTSITFIGNEGQSFATNSRFSLYGIKAA